MLNLTMYTILTVQYNVIGTNDAIRSQIDVACRNSKHLASVTKPSSVQVTATSAYFPSPNTSCQRASTGYFPTRPIIECEDPSSLSVLLTATQLKPFQLLLQQLTYLRRPLPHSPNTRIRASLGPHAACFTPHSTNRAPMRISIIRRRRRRWRCVCRAKMPRDV